MNRPVRILFFNALAISLVPLLLELVLRIFDPVHRLPYNGYVGGVPYTWGNEVVFNSWGFREDEFAIDHDDRVFRIMVLGDSLTWGVGLPGEGRYTDILQRKLSEQYPEIKWEVLNFGVDGYDATREAGVLLDFGEMVKPDLVVVGFCFNDATDKPQEFSVEREQFSRRFPGIAQVESFFSSMGLPLVGVHVRKAVYRMAELTGYIPEWPTALDRSYQPASSEWKNFRAALSDIQANAVRLTSRRPVFMVLNQVMDESTRDRQAGGLYEKLNRWYEQVLDVAVDAGFVAVDCADLVPKGHPVSWYIVNQADLHPSMAMNEIYATRLGQMMEMNPDVKSVISAGGAKP